MKRSREAWAKFLASRFAGLFIDAAIVALAYFSAVLLRLDFRNPTSIGGWSSVALLYVNVCVVYLLALIFTGCYRIPWRRTTAADLPRYLVATVLATVVLTAMRFYLPNVSLSHVRPPYSITAICFFLVTAGIFVVRLVWHAWWLSHVREEDLLERKVKNFDGSVARRFFAGKVVMVTGAGGSIGSEIVKQVAEAGAAKVLMVERGENALYEIDRRMRVQGAGCRVQGAGCRVQGAGCRVQGAGCRVQSAGCRVQSAGCGVCVPLMIDINERGKIAAVFEKYQPEIVLHAAAYKHVPMVEANPEEGWRNNTEATKQLAELAKEHGVRRFVLISTDKAVNPVSVMGKTKKAAEDAIMSLNSSPSPDTSTSFCAVRFGNVLGSSGSVVPLFREQIATLGFVTITDPEMKRYFMTVSEAVSLVLQAASRGEQAIYTLDMGESVKIVDLAERMIAQAGYRPYVDIKLVFTGVRPGEKLFEEIDVSEKSCYKTDMAKIYITKRS